MFSPQRGIIEEQPILLLWFQAVLRTIHYAAGRAGWRTVPLPTVLPFRRASRKVSNRLILWITFGGSISKWVAQALYQTDILRIWDVGRLDKQSELDWDWVGESLWGPHAVHGWI